MAMTPYPNNLAGNGTQGGYTPFQLFAGEKEIVTNNGVVPASTEIKQFQVVAMNENGQIVPYDPEGEDGSEVAVGVAAQGITTAAGSTGAIPYYVSAYFNHEALVWPASVTTLAARQMVFKGTEIQIGSLYGAEY